jgi:hypothetical protein
VSGEKELGHGVGAVFPRRTTHHWNRTPPTVYVQPFKDRRSGRNSKKEVHGTLTARDPFGTAINAL